MKTKLATLIAAAAFCATLGACGVSGNASSIGTNQPASASVSQGAGSSSAAATPVQVRKSTDKHVAYMKNYVGMNAANVGYTTLGSLRNDDYGNGRYLSIVFVTPDGSHIDFQENNDQLKDYRVSAQNVAPDTEMKYAFETDSDGEEYDNLVSFSSVTQVVLAVDRVGESGNAKDQTQITASPDQYSCYVRDYRERNLSDCGYVSLSERLTDDYGGGCYVFFDIVTDDGSYVDTSDLASLSQYKVTSQSIDPNTAISLTRHTDSSGKEYTNLVDDQSMDSITLYVTKISD